MSLLFFKFLVSRYWLWYTTKTYIGGIAKKVYERLRLYQVNFIALQRKKDPEQVLLQCVPKHKVWSGLHCPAPELLRVPFVGCKGSSALNGPVHHPRVMAGVCCHHTVGGVILTHRELGEEKISFDAVVNDMHWFPPLQALRNGLLKSAEPQLLAMYALLSSSKHEAKHTALNLSQSLHITCLTWASGVSSSTALFSAGVVRNGTFPDVPCCSQFKHWNRT